MRGYVYLQADRYQDARVAPLTQRGSFADAVQALATRRSGCAAFAEGVHAKSVLEANQAALLAGAAAGK